MKKLSALEETFLVQLKSEGLTEEMEREFFFYPSRKFRFDFAWPKYSLAVELEGGTWSNGRHVRGKGFESDCDKYNAATMMGWRIFRGTQKHLDDLSLLEYVRAVINMKIRTNSPY
jgi:hypothetical protein